MVVFSVAIMALGIIYAMLLIRYTSGFRRIVAGWEPTPQEPTPHVTVIVPARNEETWIGGCLTSILANDYPANALSVVVVDDGSEDKTSEIVSGFIDQGAEVRLLHLSAAEGMMSGKRRAIEMGISESEGTFILLTDADSEVPSTWIRTMISTFGPETRFVTGPVAYLAGRNWLGRLLELELLGLVAIGAGAIAVGRPNMCNGANVAFRRSAFLEIGGYDAIDGLTSGDDELLMQRMERIHPQSVRFCPDPAALVLTQAPVGLGALLQQRRRWASKGLHYPEKRVTALALLVYAFNVGLLGGLIASAVTASLLPGMAVAIVLKLVAEGWMFLNVCNHFDRRHLLPKVLTGQLFEIPYVVVAGAAGAAGGYRWKERTIKR